MSELTKLLEGVKVEWLALSEVANFRRGSFPQPYGNSEWYDGIGAMPFVQVNDVTKNMQLVSDTKNKISKLAQPKSVFVPKKTVIVTLQGSIGRVAITQYDAYVDRTLAIFEDYKIEICNKYFAYQLSEKFNIEKENARGSTIKTITKEEFSKFKIPIPCPDNPEKSLKIQEEIVRILDRLSEETNQLNAALQKELDLHQKQYNFYREELFKFEGKEVEWKSLGEIAEIGTGSRNTNEAVIDGEYPFFVRSQIPRKINEFEFDETAIITAGDGVGVGKVFHFVNGKYALHQRAYRIVVKSNKVNPKFLFYYIKSNFSKYVEKNSVFASVTSLRKPVFDKYPVPVASFEEQERIIKLVHDLDFTTNSIIAEIQKEIELRNKQYEYYRDRLLSF
ncbi:restriction endonuclease subunit S [Chryseobacterium sp. TY3]